jgi:L-rhamnose-H+ transport protein
MAGMMKEGELSEEQQKASVSEFSLVKGLIIAVISGILSSFFNFGVEAGGSMAEVANSAWKLANPAEAGNYIFRNNVTFVVILWGGLTTNLIWTTILSLKNRSYGDFTNKRTPIFNNILFSALAGTIWFMQFFFYGMGESKLGNGASSWILHMSTIILTANLWGVYRKEWTGVSAKTKGTITVGVAIILLSVVLNAFGNSM